MKAKVSFGKAIDTIGNQGLYRDRQTITHVGKYFFPIYLKHFGRFDRTKMPPRSFADLAQLVGEGGGPEELKAVKYGDTWEFTFGMPTGELARDIQVMSYFPLNRLAKEKMPWKIKRMIYFMLDYFITHLDLTFNDFEYTRDMWADMQEEDNEEEITWSEQIENEIAPDLQWAQIGRHMMAVLPKDYHLMDDFIRYLEGRSRYPKRKQLAKLFRKLRRYNQITEGMLPELWILKEDYLNYSDYFSVIETDNDELLDMVLQGFNDTSEIELIKLVVKYNTKTSEYQYEGTDFYKLKYGLKLYLELIELFYG